MPWADSTKKTRKNDNFHIQNKLATSEIYSSKENLTLHPLLTPLNFFRLLWWKAGKSFSNQTKLTDKIIQ